MSNVIERLCKKVSQQSIDMNEISNDYVNEVSQLLKLINESKISAADSLQIIQLLYVKYNPQHWIKEYKNGSDKDKFELLKLAKNMNMTDNIRKYVEKNNLDIDMK